MRTSLPPSFASAISSPRFDITVATTGDGLVAALQVLAIMLREGKPLSELSAGAMERVPQVLVNATLPALNILAAILLFQWKKFGFVIALVSAVFIFVLNLAIGLSVLQALFGLVGIIGLFVVLKIGNEYNQGWPQLE